MHSYTYIYSYTYILWIVSLGLFVGKVLILG